MTDSRELPFPTFAPDDDREIAQRLARSYRALPVASERQVATCLAAVLDGGRRVPAPRRLARWWWGAAAAAVLMVVVARPWRPGAPLRPADRVVVRAGAVGAPVGSTTEATSGSVRFELTLPQGATEVAIVGDFNGWDERATPMARTPTNGEWSAQVPLPPGRHVYAFVIDGVQWLVDPLAPQVPDAGYGPANAVIVDPR
jgi:hypothetical protein